MTDFVLNADTFGSFYISLGSNGTDDTVLVTVSDTFSGSITVDSSPGDQEFESVTLALPANWTLQLDSEQPLSPLFEDPIYYNRGYSIRDETNTIVGTMSIKDNSVNDLTEVTNADPIDPDEVDITAFETQITVDVVQNSTDADGQTVTVDPGSIVVVGGSAVGTAVIDPSNPEQIIFTPATGYQGDAEITYSVTDGSGGIDSSTLTVTVEPNTAPIYDLIQTNGSLPIIGDTLTTASGDLVEVDEGVVFSGPNSTQIDIGDTTVIGGVTYTVSNVELQLANVDHSGGTTSPEVKFAAIELSDGTNTFSYYVPLDSGGDFPDITSMSIISVTASPASPSVGEMSANDTVTLAAPTNSDTVPIYDMILSNGPVPQSGGTLTVADGDLLSVEDGVVFNGPNPNEIAIGDTAVIDGVTYSVSGVFDQTPTVAYDDGATTASSPRWHSFELTDGTNTISLHVPQDNQGDYPGITELTLSVQTGSDGPANVANLTSDNTVTLSIAGTDSVPIFDLIQTSGGLPNVGEELTVAAGHLIEVDEGVVFSGGVAGEINVGDTTEIAGVTYTVTDVELRANTVQHDGVSTSTGVRTVGIEMTDGTDTFSYLVPLDVNNDITEISSITTTTVLDAALDADEATISSNNNVSLEAVSQFPLAQKDFATVNEDGSVTVDVLANDSDPQGQALTITTATSPDGSVTIDNVNGTVTFTPSADFNGEAIISYTIQDPDGNIDSSSVIVDVTPVNDDPDNANTIASTDFETPVTVDVINPSTDVDGDPVTVDPSSIVVVGGPSVGTAVIDPSNPEQVTFTPANGYDGPAVIQFNAIDDDGGSSPSELTVTVAPTTESAPIYDAIQINGSTPGLGDTLTALGGDLVEVDEPLIFSGGTAENIENGDTVEIDGVTYSVSQVNIVQTDVIYDDGASTTTAPMVAVELTDGANTLSYLLPIDEALDLPEISSIEITSVEAPAAAEVALVDQDQNVSLATPSFDTPLMFDLILSNDPIPGAGSTLTVAGGDLVDVIDGVTFNGPNAQFIEVGDTTVIGGVTYTINEIQSHQADITVDGLGFSQEERIYGLEMTDGTNTITYYAVHDTAPDLPNITQIVLDTNPSFPTNFQAIDVGPLNTGLDDDDNVTLMVLPTEATYYDFIQLNDPSITGGTSSTTAAGELVEVDEPMVFTQADAAGLQVGDTTEIDGVIYSISNMNSFNSAQFTDVDGTHAVSGFIIDLTDADGNTIVYAVPEDGARVGGVNHELITEIEWSTFGRGVSIINKESIDNDDEVTLAALGTPYYDLIQIDGMPSEGDSYTTNADQLIEVDEPINFVLADPNNFQFGDTAVIDGGNWTITDLENFSVEMTDSHGTHGSATYIIELTNDDTGEVLTYAIPLQTDRVAPEVNNHENITQIDFVTMFEPAGGVTALNTYVVNADNVVTLADTCVYYDFIELNDPSIIGGTVSTTASGELAEVDEPIGFVQADPSGIQVGDTTVIDGVAYTVLNMRGFNDAQFSQTGGVQSVDGFINTLVDENGNELVYAVPRDTTRAEIDHSNITQIEWGTFTRDMSIIDKNTIDDDDNVTLIPCFVAGSQIATENGLKAIEDLQCGDKVLTQDNGYQAIRWIGSSTVAAKGNLAPIMIKAGALSNDRDLLVSPLHRMLIADWRSELLYGEEEVLVAAKHLTNGDTIFAKSGGRVKYYHMMFDHHEIVFAEGCASESFYPGDVAIGSLEEEMQEEIFVLFPELRVGHELYGPSARMELNAKEAQAMTGRAM